MAVNSVIRDYSEGRRLDRSRPRRAGVLDGRGGFAGSASRRQRPFARASQRGVMLSWSMARRGCRAWARLPFHALVTLEAPFLMWSHSGVYLHLRFPRLPALIAVSFVRGFGVICWLGSWHCCERTAHTAGTPAPAGMGPVRERERAR